MKKPEIIEEEPVNMSKLRGELIAIEERDEELSFRGSRTKDYLDNYYELDPEEAEELVQDLNDLDIARLKPSFVHKIVDFLPEDMDELDVILKGYTLSISEENKQAVLEVVSDYR